MRDPWVLTIERSGAVDTPDPAQSGVACPRCGGAARVTPGPFRGGHHARADCVDCHHTWWLPKPDSERSPDPGREVSRAAARRLSRGFCLVCLRRFDALAPPDTMEGHHVVQVRDGGTDDDSNIWVVCTACHRVIHWLRTYLNRPAAAGTGPRDGGD